MPFARCAIDRGLRSVYVTAFAFGYGFQMSRFSGSVILFDLDGTLADTAPDLAAALNHVLTAIDLAPIPPDHIRHMVGQGARRLIVDAMARHDRDPTQQEIERLIALFLDHYRENIAAESKAFPGVREALDALKAGGARLGVATNKFEDLSHSLLGKLGLDHYFDLVAGADTFPVRKPDPGHLLMALDRLGGDVARSAMVGDSETDISAARAANIPVVGVTFGYTPVPVADLDPDALIDRFDELVPALERLLPRAEERSAR